MRIQPGRRSQVCDPQHLSQIAEAVAPKGVAGRVCGEGCTIKCPQCGSTGCQCRCSPACPEAPRELSSDPVYHPIEPGIVPLVFELKRLALFDPCWSCEGHTRADGQVLKVPRVWFTCASMVHVRLLSSAVARLHAGAKLHYAWQIVVTYSDPDNPYTTFSLEPAPSPDADLSLSRLQADAAAIARSLQAVLSEEARHLQHEAARPR
jgi:hypothetical protein